MRTNGIDALAVQKGVRKASAKFDDLLGRIWCARFVHLGVLLFSLFLLPGVLVVRIVPVSRRMMLQMAQSQCNVQFIHAQQLQRLAIHHGALVSHRAVHSGPVCKPVRAKTPVTTAHCSYSLQGMII